MKQSFCKFFAFTFTLKLAKTFSVPSISRSSPPSRPCCPEAIVQCWTVETGPRRRLRVRAQVHKKTALAAGKIVAEVGDVKRALSSARDRLEKNRELLDEAKLKGELEYLERVSSEANFWDNGASARKTLGELNRSLILLRILRARLDISTCG